MIRSAHAWQDCRLAELSCAADVQEQLEFLAFENVGCSVNACAAVKELLKHPGQLRSFHFYNNMSDDAGATSIAEVFVCP